MIFLQENITKRQYLLKLSFLTAKYLSRCTSLKVFEKIKSWVLTILVNSDAGVSECGRLSSWNGICGRSFDAVNQGTVSFVTVHLDIDQPTVFLTTVVWSFTQLWFFSISGCGSGSYGVAIDQAITVLL